jgi:hypothetical protein
METTLQLYLINKCWYSAVRSMIFESSINFDSRIHEWKGDVNSDLMSRLPISLKILNHRPSRYDYYIISEFSVLIVSPLPPTLHPGPVQGLRILSEPLSKNKTAPLIRYTWFHISTLISKYWMFQHLVSKALIEYYQLWYKHEDKKNDWGRTGFERFSEVFRPAGDWIKPPSSMKINFIVS